MPVRVTQENILTLSADAVVISVEIDRSPTQAPVCQAVAAAGGRPLSAALSGQKFLSVGRAAMIETPYLPFPRLIYTGAPEWMTGKANELLLLHRCYNAVFDLAESALCESLVMPFLSAMFYRFPQDEAVKIACAEAQKRSLDVCFVADTPELYAVSRKPYRKPRIVSYIGYYRDHAIFELDNGFFARVDIRPEIEDVTPIPYFEACFRTGNNPLLPPLPESEIARLRQIYEHNDW